MGNDEKEKKKTPPGEGHDNDDDGAGAADDIKKDEKDSKTTVTVGVLKQRRTDPEEVKRYCKQIEGFIAASSDPNEQAKLEADGSISKVTAGIVHQRQRQEPPPSGVLLSLQAEDLIFQEKLKASKKQNASRPNEDTEGGAPPEPDGILLSLQAEGRILQQKEGEGGLLAEERQINGCRVTRPSSSSSSGSGETTAMSDGSNSESRIYNPEERTHHVGAFPIPGLVDNTTESEEDLTSRQDTATEMEEGTRRRGQPADEPIAEAVTRDDLEEEVRKEIMEGAPTAEILEQNETGKRHRRVIMAVGLVLIAALLVAIIVSTKNQRGSSNNGGNNDNEDALGEPQESKSEKKKTGWVYVISNKTVNWCGHNNHRANKCGGSLASINTPEEKAIVDRLKDIALENARQNNATSWGGPIKGVWIGGEQSLNSRNDSGILEEDVLWMWADGSPWFDGSNKSGIDDLSNDDYKYGNYWAPNEPNNTIDILQNQTKGEHFVLLTPDGKYMDEHGCFGKLAPKAPGIYILPEDYADFEKYPDCQPGNFLEGYDTPVPPRPEPEWVYVLSQSYHWICGEDSADWATNCGGYRASITNVREKAIVDKLMDIAIKQADREGRTDVDGVWIGAAQSLESQNNNGQFEDNVTWQWADGSVWFDNGGAYWADGQPDNVIYLQANSYGGGDIKYDRGEHYVMLNKDGKYEDTLDCSMLGKQLPSIFILPPDYSDRTKYMDCQTSTFTTHIPVPQRP